MLLMSAKYEDRANRLLVNRLGKQVVNLLGFMCQTFSSLGKVTSWSLRWLSGDIVVITRLILQMPV